MTKKVTFEDEAKSVKIDGLDVVGVWTDGVMLTSDNGKSPLISGHAPCDMYLTKGKRYRVTVEELE